MNVSVRKIDQACTLSSKFISALTAALIIAMNVIRIIGLISF